MPARKSRPPDKLNRPTAVGGSRPQIVEVEGEELRSFLENDGYPELVSQIP